MTASPITSFLSKRRSGIRTFSRLLLEGQRTNWRHGLVVVSVITGMFSTPLVLGSIRNRAYVAVRDRIEREDNVREVSLRLARENAPPLDDRLIGELEKAFPDIEVVGSHALAVGVEGPAGSDFLTLQTLVPGDPRQAALQISPKIPEDFGLTDLVVSDGLGRLLYGEPWESLWQGDAFTGPPLALAIDDSPLSSRFDVVARRRSPGRGLYASARTGSALRQYAEGLGAPELRLSADPELMERVLPKLAPASCLLLLDVADPTCDRNARERLLRRLGRSELAVGAPAKSGLPPLAGRDVLHVDLPRERAAAPGDCRQALAPHVLETCSAADVAPELALHVTLETGGERVITTVIAAADRELWELLPEARQVVRTRGTDPKAASRALGLAAPAPLGLTIGQEVALRAGGTWVPARVERLYDCPPGGSCVLLAEPLAVFRLQNLAQGLIALSSRDPLRFGPLRTAAGFGEVLVYARRVEDVERVGEELRARYPGYSVRYDVVALDELRRQDLRLATLFALTVSLSSLSIVMALGALAQIDVERRRRQMAQMLLLGLSRRFVRWLIVAEYLLLTAVAAAAAAGITTLFCAAARSLLAGGADGDHGFGLILRSMAVDPVAFWQVLAAVALCTGTIAAVSARRAARRDHLDPLD